MRVMVTLFAFVPFVLEAFSVYESSTRARTDVTPDMSSDVIATNEHDRVEQVSARIEPVGFVVSAGGGGGDTELMVTRPENCSRLEPAEFKASTEQ